MRISDWSSDVCSSDLDDAVLAGAIEQMVRGGDAVVGDLGRRLRERRLYKTLDVRAFGREEGHQRIAARRLDTANDAKCLSGPVLTEEGAGLSISTQTGRRVSKATDSGPRVHSAER